MNSIKRVLIFFCGMLCGLMHASEGIELLNLAEFEVQYSYSFQNIAAEEIKQIAVNSTYAYLLTKKGTVYRAQNNSAKQDVDLNTVEWELINTEGDVSFIALYPEKDVSHSQDFIYATHSYFLKDRVFSYNTSIKQSMELASHNTAIYTIGAVFDQYNERSCVLSASTFPSMQLYTGTKLSPSLKNAYLLHAQENQLVYAELQAEKNASVNVFEKAIGKTFPYKLNIIWDTMQLDTLRLTQVAIPKRHHIKIDQESDLILPINNVKDLPLVAIDNTQDAIQIAAVVALQKKELSITFNYHLDELFLYDVIMALPNLTSDQKGQIVLANPTARTDFDFKKIYYTEQPDSMLHKFKNVTVTMKRDGFRPISAAYITHGSQKISVNDIVKDTISQVLLLVHQNSVECVFVKDLQNTNSFSRKFSIDFKGKKILCTFFDQQKKILYCVTEDQEKNIAIEVKNIITEVNAYFKQRAEHAEKTKKAAEALKKYQTALQKIN